jgi:hypothetical protein
MNFFTQYAHASSVRDLWLCDEIFTQLIQQLGRFENRRAVFSEVVMAAYLYKKSAESSIARGFAKIWVANVRALG